MRASQFIHQHKKELMSQKKHKYFGASVKALPHQHSVVNINQAKLFHAIIGNMTNQELALNIDVSKYVNPADLYPLESIVIGQEHCEFGLRLHPRQVAQAAILGYRAMDVMDILARLTKEFDDGSCVRCLYIYGNTIVAPVASFVEALWEACGIVVAQKYNQSSLNVQKHK